MENEIEEDVLFFSDIRLFMRREIFRIRGYFEVTVPLYELDVFRSHFRMSRTTFELLAQMIIPSKHIPNGNAFGRPVVEPDKHCSEVTHTTAPSVALNASATMLQASFFRIFPDVKLACFSFLIDISNLV